MRKPYDDTGMPTSDDIVKDYFASQGKNPDGSPLDSAPQEAMPAPPIPAPEAAPAMAPQGMDPKVQQYLAQKFNLGEYGDENRKKLQEDSKVGMGDKAMAALAALGAGFSGKDAGAAGQAHLKASKDEKGQALQDFDKGRANKIQEFGLDRDANKAQREDETYGRDQDKLKREMDPNSQESKMANDLATSMGYKGAPITAAQFKDFSPVMQKKYEIAEKALDRTEQRKDRESDRAFRREDSQLRRDEMNQRKDEVKTDKQSRQTEQDIQKLSKDVAGTQDMVNGLDEVEKELGFKLDDADASGGSLKVGGKARDLPGVSLPGIGRVTAYSDDARRLQGAAAKVFNTVLKDRSGAAVSNQEMERMKAEFGEGKYNSESDMVNALQRYKRAVQTELKNREAAYNPDVVNKYQEQGGRTSKTLSTTAPTSKIRVSNGTETMEIDPSDEADAAKDGYKRI